MKTTEVKTTEYAPKVADKVAADGPVDLKAKVAEDKKTTAAAEVKNEKKDLNK